MRRFLKIWGYIAFCMGAFLLILSLPACQCLRMYLPQVWYVSLCGLGLATIGLAASWVRDTRRRRGEQGEQS